MLYQETTIQITFRHPMNFTEVLPNDVVSTEVAIENGFALPLMELYGGAGEVIIEKVTVLTAPTMYMYEDAIIYRTL